MLSKDIAEDFNQHAAKHARNKRKWEDPTYQLPVNEINVLRMNAYHKEQDRNFKKARDLIKEFETKKKKMEDSIKGETIVD